MFQLLRLPALELADDPAQEPEELTAFEKYADVYATDLHREALIACGVVLFVFILLINLCFSAVKRKADAT